VNAALAVVALVLAANAPRRRPALSTDDTVTVALGGLLAALLFVALAAVASPLTDALDISRPNLRIAAGVVLAVVSMHDLVWRRPRPGAALPGRGAALVPVFFPVLARPEIGLLAMSVGADHGVLFTALAAGLSMAVVVGWHALATPRVEQPVFARVEGGAARVDAALALAAAVAVTADGVFAI
jgi:small neutral amino acid transporter SnatA (MarC family)